MAYEADSVVVELIAKTDGFDQKVKASAANFGVATGSIGKNAAATEQVLANLKRKMATALETGNTGSANKLAAQIAQIEGALSKVAATSGRSRMGMQQLGYQFNDIASQMAMGTRASTIFAQQSGQVIQALQLMGGGGNAFLRFLGGPWGVALSVAAIALTPLIGKLFDAKEGVGDLVAKLKEHYEQSKLSDQAHQAFDRTIEGSIAKMDELTKAIRQQNLTLEDNVNLAKAAAATALGNVVTNIGTVSTQLAAAIKRYNDAKAALADAENGNFGNATDAAAAVGAAQAQLAGARDQVRTLTAQLVALNQTAENGARALNKVDFPLIEQNAKDAVDPIAKINRKYDEMAAKAKQAGTYTQQLADQIERQRKVALEAAKATDKLSKADPSAQFKASVIGAEGTGPNRLGSSAAGFGQFMPSTWLGYFDKLFPDKADLDQAAKLEFRNVREVAVAVIDAATKDYVAVLRSAGKQITSANLYAVHLLGAGDAKKLLNAAPGAQTSSFLSPQVLAGNPFLRGTASSALAAIGQRIGQSSGAVSSGATALQRILDQQQTSWDKLGQTIAQQADKERELSVLESGRLNFVEEFNRQGGVTLAQLVQQIADVTGLTQQYEQLGNTQKELNDFGNQMIDEVLNPDNWKNWGDAAKSILHEIEMELFKLAAINPLKNALSGSNLPTLGSVFKLFGGGGGSVPFDLGESTAAINSMLGLAGGGSVSGPGTATSDSIPAMLSDGEFVINAAAVKRIGVGALDALNSGRIHAFAEGGLVRGISPSNDRAISGLGGAGSGFVLVQIEASEYFDGRVMSVTGPVIAQAGVRSANGGAMIARRNLSREQMHRLD